MIRFDSNICIFEDSEGATLCRRPLPKVTQKSTKNQTSNQTRFSLKMEPPGTPKGHLKSQKIIPNPPRERMGKPSHRVPEKTGSWTLPGTSPCLSRTVPAMLLARSTRCLWTTFSTTLGSILAPFLSPWAPKWRLGNEKKCPENTSKNYRAKNPGKWSKHPPNRV